MGRTALDDAVGYAACPQSLLLELPGLAEALPADATCLLLEHRPQWQALYTLMGLPVLDMPQLLAAFAIPHLMSLPDRVQVRILFLHTD